MPYYVFDDAKNKIEGMSREQIINAIAAATGLTPEQVDEDIITTAIKEQNAQRSVNLWVGTQAEYNAIQQPDENTLYVVTDPNETNEMQAQIDALKAEVEQLHGNALLWGGSAGAGDEITLTEPLKDFQNIVVYIEDYAVICAFKDNPAMGVNGYYTGSLYDAEQDTLVCVKLYVLKNTNDKGISIQTAETRSAPFSGGNTTAAQVSAIRGYF